MFTSARHAARTNPFFFFFFFFFFLNYTKYAVCDCTWPLLKKLYKGRELLNMLTDVQKYSHYIRGGICERRETI